VGEAVTGGKNRSEIVTTDVAQYMHFPYMWSQRLNTTEPVVISHHCYLLHYPNDLGCWYMVLDILAVSVQYALWSSVSIECWSVRELIACVGVFIRTNSTIVMKLDFWQQCHRHDTPTRNSLLLWTSNDMKKDNSRIQDHHGICIWFIFWKCGQNKGCHKICYSCKFIDMLQHLSWT
jgi:hypothetical protein